MREKLTQETLFSKYQDTIVEVFKTNQVRLAYLFGSVAERKTTSLSDIDIAVLLPQDLTKKELFKARLKFLNTLSSILSTDHLDIIILNIAPPVLSYQVLKYGQLLYEVNSDERIAFFVRVVDQYLDTEPLRKLGYEYSLKIFRGGLPRGYRKYKDPIAAIKRISRKVGKPERNG